MLPRGCSQISLISERATPKALRRWVATSETRFSGARPFDGGRRLSEPVPVRMPKALALMPLLQRAVVVGAVSAAAAGSVLGLVIGLFTYAPTAPFAVVELGLPAAVAGAVTGLAIGSIILAVRRIARGAGSR